MNSKFNLSTPCLILDLDMLEHNMTIMKKLTNDYGKNIRPHAKTHKCTELAKLQIEGGAIGICAAKISEAEVLVKSGINNVLITGPIVTKNKIEKLIELLKIDPSLSIAVDNSNIISAIDASLNQKGQKLSVLLDIDVGQKRTGVNPLEAIKIADQIVKSKNLILRGIQAYAGHLQHVTSYEKRKELSHTSLELATKLFQELSVKIPTCRIFSTSGTGTFNIDAVIPEITEFQVGSYIVMDVEYLTVVKLTDEIRNSFKPALRLLTTVVSANQKGFVTVDAGLKSIYQDAGNPLIFNPKESNYSYDWFGDEYGKISYPENTKPPKMGDVIALVIPHCDPTINLFDKYFVMRGEKVVKTWNIDLRGCSQ